MRIERAGMEDVDAIVALERETPSAPHWGEQAYRAAVTGQDGGLRRCLLVARIGKDLTGFAAGSLVAGTAELESVAVRASARRQGIGRALCEAVGAWAWRHGGLIVELEVRAGAAGARVLYAKLGFVECGLRTHYYSDPMDDAVRMRLERPHSKA